MKLTKNISFKNYKNLQTNKKIFSFFKKIKKENNQILRSMSTTYRDSFNKKKFLSLKNTHRLDCLVWVVQAWVLRLFNIF